MKDISRSNETLSPKKRELLELLLKEKARSKAEAASSTIPRRRGEEPLVPSFSQQRLWFLDQLEPGSAAYNIPAAVRLLGELDTGLLERAYTEVVQRHEDLRITFTSVEGRPRLVIAPELRLPLRVDELTDLPAGERETEALRRVADEASRPFDLATGPLLRLTLLRLGERDHVLLLIIHHIISDVWSIGVFFREIVALYEAFSAGRPSPLPELPIQYPDFALWQQQWLSGDSPQKQLVYWKKQLGGAPAVLELPTDRPRPPVQTFRGARRNLHLPAELVRPLQALGQMEDASLFMTLQAGLAVLLGRYTGQEEVLTGTPMANRTRVELERLIGFFVNMLVLRSDMTGTPTFRQLLARVREATLGAYANHDLPLETILEELSLERDPSRNPLFQVTFAFQNAPVPPLAAPGLSVQPFEIQERTSRFDLEFDLRDVGDGFGGFIAFNTDLFEPSTIDRMARCYATLLAAAGARPDERISELPLLTSEERNQLLVGWNHTAASYPREEPVHRLFEAQAARTPDAVALETDRLRMTYRELDRRANRLALHLRDLGVGAEDLVGLCAERSPELIVGLLAILKAGAAYLPLDPAYPVERLAFLLADAGAGLVLAQPALAGALPEEARVVPLIAEEEGETAPSVPVGGDHLAYVMYTSGSTGTPKGVAVPHRAVARLVLGTGYARFGEGEVMLHFAPASFDASTFEIWGALLHGGRLAIHPPGTPSLEELGQFLREHGCTTVWLTAGLFHEIVERAPETLSGVRQLLAGGDALSLPHVRKALAVLDGTLINGYGPTEGTTFTCCHPMTSTEGLDFTVPIGRPIANTRVHLLDSAGQPAPVGVLGELYAGGDGLARGYHGRPDLTAERFVPDPFNAGERLYRTGDLARWRPDGSIEFLGRTDHQVKVRGFRIEPGEIEAALARHPTVGPVVVMAREDRPGDKRLVAYFVPREGADAPTVTELRDFLGERLPSYMVPSAFVQLSDLPLTANGKVDRRALPAPDGTRPEMEAQYVEPRTAVERQLAALWSEVLEVERVGARDSFFELGGQSLLATQIVSRVRDAFGVEVPLRALFQEPTVEGLAAAVEEARLRGRSVQTDIPLVPLPRDGRLPLSFAQERLWFIDQLVPGLSAYNIPGAVRLTGRLDLGALERSLDEIARRHEVLRTTFHSVDGRPVARVAPELRLLTPVVDLRGLPAEARETEALRLANAAAAQAFDLSRGPLLRTLLLRLSERDHLMALVLHHIVYDMWSREIFLTELATLYTASVQGRPSPLPELVIQYADFAGWQRQWLTGEVLAEQLTYWRRQLDGIPAALELPPDRPRPAVQTFRGTRAFLATSPELTATLKALSQREGVTLFITLLAGFYTLLHRYTGQTDLPVGSPIANRNRTETEALMGFFANTLVLRGDLAGGPPFRELLARVREAALGAYAHQDLAFEQLVNELQPGRDLGRQPLFQVMFNFVQNYMPPAFELPDLTLSPEWIHGGEVQFDFTLSLWEAGGRLYGALDYSTDLFNTPTVLRMLRHFERLLESAAADPGLRAGELRLLGEAELDQVLRGWNDTAGPSPVAGTFLDLFEAVVARDPEALALVDGGVRLTYGELDRRTGRLARRLAALGAGPEVVVGLLAERGADLVTAILGVQAAGAAWLPLDPHHPAQRHAQVLGQSGAPLVLAAPELLPVLQEAVGELDGPRPRLLTFPEILLQEAVVEETAPVRPCGANLAYVIFTSGSTGLPKGAMVEQKGMFNHLLAKIADLELTARDAVAQTASQCFDISVWQMLVSLAVGGRVHVYPDEVAHDPEGLLDRVEADGITILEVVPSVQRAMLDAIALRGASRPGLASLRWLIATGEALPPDLCRRWLEEYPQVPLVNAYGPTECSDDVTHAFFHHPPAAETTRVTIGRPILNMRLYVLDRELRLVPAGVGGELCVGGVGVGRGYLNDPARTAAVFVPDPFAAEPGARLYRTGDLARWLAEGQLDFLGRLDHQVKVRGFRIELGEIEVALGRHPAVREAAVLARGADQDRSLVAFLVLAGEEDPGDRELRDALRRQLPEYMVPPAFVRLPAMPLTPNGKLDRKALLALAGDGPALETELVAPRTPVEETLAGLWAEVLGRERVGVHDNFFELGGHSLLVTQVVSRLRGAFGVELPLRTMFETPTVAGLAETVETILWARQAPEPVGVLAGGEEEGEL